MNFDGAIVILRNGGKVTRPNWDRKHYFELSKDGYERILCHDGTNASVHLKQIEAEDWVIWKEDNLITALEEAIDRLKLLSHELNELQNKLC